MKLFIAVLFFQTSLFANSLVGTWRAECRQESQGYSQGRAIVGATTLEIAAEYYDDNRCTDMLAKGSLKSSVQFEEPGENAIRRYDVVYTEMMMTIVDGPTAMMANIMKVCGFSNWKVNVPKNVAGRICFEKQVPNIGDKNYSIAALNEVGQLLVGELTDELDGSTPEKRPVDLDESRPFTKEVRLPADSRAN